MTVQSPFIVPSWVIVRCGRPSARYAVRPQATPPFLCLWFLFAFEILIGGASTAEVVQPENESIPYGYLFIDQRFVPAPYVVRSEQMTVTVNGHVVSRLTIVDPPVEPPSTADASANLGLHSPPVGTSPLDGRKEIAEHWQARLRHLREETPRESVAKVIVEEINRVSGVEMAAIHPTLPDYIEIYEQVGDLQIPRVVPIFDQPRSFKSTDARAEGTKNQKRFAEMLRHMLWKDLVVWIYNEHGGLSSIDPDNQSRFLQVLAKDVEPQTQREELIRAGIIPAHDDLWTRFIHRFLDRKSLSEHLHRRLDHRRNSALACYHKRKPP